MTCRPASNISDEILINICNVTIGDDIDTWPRVQRTRKCNGSDAIWINCCATRCRRPSEFQPVPQATDTQIETCLLKMKNQEKEAAGLKMLVEKALQCPVNPRHVAYCPTMDLLALATADEQTHVFRTNGQRVFSVSRKEPGGKIADIKWKPDGMLNYADIEG